MGNGAYKGQRFTLTIDKNIYRDLEVWAKKQNMLVAGLGRSLVEGAVVAAKARGEIPGAAPCDSAVTFIRALAGDGEIDAIDLQRLADTIGIDSAKLAKLLKEHKNASVKS